MKNEPIRHHYIPQFILKNFCIPATDSLWYFDKQSNQLSEKKTRDVFMVENLYRDEINIPDNPTEIEQDLAVYENEISRIIKEKFLHDKDIVLNFEDYEKVKLFFAIMSFRSKATNKMFGEEMLHESKSFYRQYQKNRDFQDLWKRNLGYIVKCRSIFDVIENPNIDEPFKGFFIRDTIGISGLHVAVLCAEKEESFLIGDTYPVDTRGVTDNGTELPLYAIFPISYNRIVLIFESGAKESPRSVTHFRECIFHPPMIQNDTGTIRIRAKKLYPEEVEHINREILKNSVDGVAASNKEIIHLMIKDQHFEN